MSAPADGLLSPLTAGTEAARMSDDAALLSALVRAEECLLRALAATGVLPAEADVVAGVVAGVDLDPVGLARAASAGGNPVIPLVAELREAVGPEAAAWVHHGATSQDILDTALMLLAEQVRVLALDRLQSAAGTLAAWCVEARGVPTVARTLTQQAMPTTLGMRAAGWLTGVHDAVDSLRALEPPASLGGAVGTGAAYGRRGPAVLEEYAARLGLRAPTMSWHTNRGPMLALGAALEVTGAACGSIAADLLVMGQNEVGEVRDRAAGPSSAMAHKANPVRAVLVASGARQLPVLISVLGGSAVAENERPAGAWHAEWEPARTALAIAGAAAERTADLLPDQEFDQVSMARNLDLLLDRLQRDRGWAGSQVAHVDAWIDRVLDRNAALFAPTP